MSGELLYRVSCAFFVAGFVVRDGVVIDAAPILRWTIGKTLRSVMLHCRKRGRRCEFVA